LKYEKWGRGRSGPFHNQNQTVSLKYGNVYISVNLKLF